MSKILYVIDNNKKTQYHYDIEEDTIIYHFSINSSSEVFINLCKEKASIKYYYNNINYKDNTFHITVHHSSNNTYSEVFNHGVNVLCDKLAYTVNGIVPNTSSKCICNQDNQIINLKDGKSTICPNLLIDNYDVDSNHAAYIGKFKDEELFYIMSRGISQKKADELLLKGFLIYDGVNLKEIPLFLEEIKKI